MLKALKFYTFMVLLVIAVAAAFFFLPGFGGAFNRDAGKTVSIHTVARQYLESAQMVTLHCKYSDVFEMSEEKLKNIYGMRIPGTEKHVIIKTRGTVFLGIDCKKITVDTTRSDTLFMTLPPIEILAHESEFTDVYDLSGIFRKYNLKEVPELRNTYKAEIEFHTKNDKTAIAMAETAAEKALNNFYNMLQYIPALKKVPIVFYRTPVVKNISIDIKRETPADMQWEMP